MLWKIENVVGNTIVGWAYDASYDGPIEILALKNASIITRVNADESRSYLSRQGHSRTTCGFLVELPESVDVDSVRLVCMPPSLRGECLVIFSSQKEEIGRVLPSYQKSLLALSEDSLGSSSRSEEKLRALHLPSLRGLEVLDLGCNEGYFCSHAIATGAKSVLGIDSSELSIERAKARCKETRSVFESIDGPPLVKFQCGSWWDIPERKFDVILFLSAIHYEPDQQKLLDFLASHLKPEGFLVLECGVVPSDRHFWKPIQRSIDTRRFPTRALLTDTLLRAYASRYIGMSVNQAGDPLPREVYHCFLRKSTVCIIRGASGSGKTVLANQFKQRGVSGYSSDFLFTDADNKNVAKTPDTPLYAIIREKIDSNQLNLAAELLIESNCVEEFCQEFILRLPLEDDFFYIEGEVFKNDVIYEEFVEQLKEKGIIAWDVQRA